MPPPWPLKDSGSALAELPLKVQPLTVGEERELNMPPPLPPTNIVIAVAELLVKVQ